MTPTEKALREKLAALVGDIWMAYERALDADESDGCEHTPDGDPLVCCDCRMRRFELVATPRLAAILAESEDPKLAPVNVSIANSDVERVFGHKCDMPTCPACAATVPKLEPGDEWDTPEGRTHHVGDDCPGGHVEEPTKLPLGHEFAPNCGQMEGTDHCWLCGQPRSAHSPQPAASGLTPDADREQDAPGVSR